ncbi:hypothetical protein Godav_013517 [Gossypium davidsonii]|uniref:Uncharacterized protein n=2 Tax=Gossypium TaxID=3633 RepID=A0A7J8RGL8_GOSDV|nr:hypothetical protein [Gossypium davidsonii]MBA0648195.1 hypothetical protein [Gossypium klotzschianum]
MSAGLGKYTKIRHIVRLRQMLQRWRNKARMSARRIPSDVPVGHVANYVGTSCRRFVVRVFWKLLIQAEEERLRRITYNSIASFGAFPLSVDAPPK